MTKNYKKLLILQAIVFTIFVSVITTLFLYAEHDFAPVILTEKEIEELYLFIPTLETVKQLYDSKNILRIQNTYVMTFIAGVSLHIIMIPLTYKINKRYYYHLIASGKVESWLENNNLNMPAAKRKLKDSRHISFFLMIACQLAIPYAMFRAIPPLWFTIIVTIVGSGIYSFVFLFWGKYSNLRLIENYRKKHDVQST